MTDYEQTLPPPLEVSQENRLWAAGAHAAALIAAFMTTWFAGIAGALAALVIWFVVRDRYAFAAEHAKEAFNFNLSMFIYAVIASIIAVVLVGATIFTLGIGALVTIPAGLVVLALLGLLALAWLVFTIIAAVKAYDGKSYRYPLTIRLLN